MPRLLTTDQKRIRVTTSEQYLAYFYRNWKQFLHRFVTMNETWIHHYTPESESAPKHPKTQQSAGKHMASVFLNANAAIFIDYLKKGRVITGAYYAALLDRLVDEIRKNRPHLKKK